MSDVAFTQETVDRFHRWLANTGFDGGVDSPPFMILGVVLAQRDRIEKLEAAISVINDKLCEVRAADLGYDEACEEIEQIVQALQSGEAR